MDNNAFTKVEASEGRKEKTFGENRALYNKDIDFPDRCYYKYTYWKLRRKPQKES